MNQVHPDLGLKYKCWSAQLIKYDTFPSLIIQHFLSSFVSSVEIIRESGNITFTFEVESCELSWNVTYGNRSFKLLASERIG